MPYNFHTDASTSSSLRCAHCGDLLELNGVAPGDDLCQYCRTAETYVTKDSGQREEFPTGSRRDSREGKGRYDLLPSKALRRVALLYARGAAKYGDVNWQLGQPYSRCMDSLLRDAFQALDGQTDEDHLAAVVWNALAIIQFQEEGRTDLDDLEERRRR
jgi:hypothetical protein